MRLSAIGLVAVSLMVFFVFLIARVTAPQMELLYRDLDPGDASAIVAQLDAQQVPYELLKGGTEILVPGDMVNRMRLSMAQEGLPAGGSIGYEIFDQADTFGATTFEQNISHLRALEGELQRTISSMDKVQASRVHLVLPKRELFSRQQQEPSASVALKLRGSRLDREQVLAIQHLVAAAVPKLEPNKIAVIDERGNLLARGLGDEGSGQFMAQNIDEQKVRIETRLRETIEDLLSKTVGFGKVRAEVAVEMDFDRVTREEQIFDPEGQVVRSAQAIEESALSTENEGTDPVTLETNLPDPGVGAGQGGASLRTEENRTEETTNFEVSNTVTRTVKEVGAVKRVTASVLVDGTYTTNENGEQIYQERSEEELTKLAVLVQGAIGFSDLRDDKVEVINMQFVDVGDVFGEDQLDTFFGFDRRDLFNLAELLALTIVGILVILLVIRPLLTRMFEALPAADDMTERKLLAEPALTEAAALAGPKPAPAPGSGRPGIDDENADELINISQVEGRVKASSVKKIGEIVDKHPEEALSIIRNWLYQET